MGTATTHPSADDDFDARFPRLAELPDDDHEAQIEAYRGVLDQLNGELKSITI
ncbi:hypothetical protein KIH77_00675 [Bifidobacterium sp. 82T24]|uniref:hypothetical protein n=1 Tax=Bifidobacterium pluvialisilvae TaxID=2834436 RepID=UPI001C5614B0|nr:hypothetical protein [Bifidobacterium pluvialisilvae]MBW3087259.1 hypothetical protein [Bifidobacterium pluvialisilvae]